MRSPISPSNRLTPPTIRLSTPSLGASSLALGKDDGVSVQTGRRVEVPLGARAYSILIGPGVLDEAGAEIAKIAPGVNCAVVTDAQVAPLYLDRLTEKPGTSGFAIDLDRLSARRGHEVVCRVRSRRRCADRGSHRAERHGHRARRGRHRRSCRILRCNIAPWRAIGADPNDAAGSGRFKRRRQNGNQFPARKKPRRRLSSAIAGAGGHNVPRFP